MTRLNFSVSILLSFFLVILSFESIAQARTVKGTLRNNANEALIGGTIRIPSINKFASTDAHGRFEIQGVPYGTYQLVSTYVGHHDQTITITVNATSSSFDLKLDERTDQLSEVVVTGKSDNQIVKEQSIKAEVINMKAFATQPSTMIDLMNRSAGVRVRQTGGLGSNANVTVNGFQDKAIKYFRDGIPMDYLGAGYNFALVPVNMLERLEIYKGVLPANLGADALGGGLNMVTKKSLTRYAEASYEVASFNTHRASLNLYYQDTAKHYFVGADAFYNHSDNDYEVTAPVTDPDLGTQSDVKVKLFNNKFTHYYGELYGGIANTKWADELRITVTGFHIDRQNQYGSRMSQPFGASTSKQYAIIPTIRYQKSFNGKFFVDQFLVANTIHVQQVDTARGVYNWYGEFIPSNTRRGEMTTSGSLAKTDFSYFTSRTNLTYKINATHKLELNAVYTGLSRVGNDPLGLKFVASGRDILSVPAYYNKWVTALALESKLFNARLSNTLMGKFYRYETRAVDGDYYGNEQDRSETNERFGAAEAVKFSINERSFVRGSAEIATRLPEQDELFGDGNLHVSNFALKPERSVNFNAGYSYSKFQKFSFEFNSFYRITHDLILNVPYNFLFNRHENVSQVKGLGVETDANVSVLPWLKVNGNFTYQNFRLFDTGNKSTEGARLRNTPYFFANLGLTAARQNLLGKRDRLQAYWYFTFVKEYYLDYVPKDREPDGFLGLFGKAKFDAPNIIPNQSIHTAGVTYFPYDNKLSMGLQMKNIFNTAVFDNFRIQNAGRSIHLKLTYTIK